MNYILISDEKEDQKATYCLYYGSDFGSEGSHSVRPSSSSHLNSNSLTVKHLGDLFTKLPSSDAIQTLNFGTESMRNVLQKSNVRIYAATHIVYTFRQYTDNLLESLSKKKKNKSS